jgi:hypothetical protein
MATYTWTLQGTTPTTIDATDLIQFAGGTFGSAIVVGAFNSSTHVETAGAADKSSANTPKNSKYLTSGTVDIGGGSVALNTITTGNCPLKINFAHGSAVTVTGHKLYAYDGSVTTNGPTDITFYAANQGDAAWTLAEGSGSALAITDSGSATSHDFFFLISASPDSVGLKTAFKLRDELTYS